MHITAFLHTYRILFIYWEVIDKTKIDGRFKEEFILSYIALKVDLHLWSISNSKDIMIKVGPTSASWKNTTNVKLEYSLISLNSNWNRSNCDSWSKSTCIVSRNIMISRTCAFSLWFKVLAGSILGSVRIIVFKHQWMGLNVLESIVH